MENKTIVLEDYKHTAQLSFMKHLKSKTVLIIGANGWIGNFLVNTLCMFNNIYSETPCHIIAWCHTKKGEYIDNNNVECILGDICSADIRNIDCDYIIFTAGGSDPYYFYNSPVTISNINTIGLKKTIDIALNNNITSMVFLSSASVYGKTDSKKLDETQSGIINFYDPAFVYCESKRMGECICMSFAKQYGLHINIVRPFHMFGPCMNLNGTNMINRFVSNILNNYEISFNNSSFKKRNYTYIRDIISQIFLVLFYEKYGDIFNLGNEKNTLSTKNFAEKLISSKKVQINYKSQRSFNPTNDYDMVPNLAKIKNIGANRLDLLDLDTGIERMWKYYYNK